MKYGYARVSTVDQNLDLQLEALEKVGCEKICKEKISGTSKYKPVLDTLLNKLKSGDQLVIWKLDRLGRKSGELIKLQETLEHKEIALISLTEQLDTSSPVGKFGFQMLCCVAEMERNVISERTIAGLIAAKNQGRIGGRKPGLSAKSKKKAGLVAEAYMKNEKTISELCIIFNLSRATLYKYLRIKKIKLRNTKK